jgi:hypothetical protein
MEENDFGDIPTPSTTIGCIDPKTMFKDMGMGDPSRDKKYDMAANIFGNLLKPISQPYQGLGSVTVNGVGTITVTDEDTLQVADSLFDILSKKVGEAKDNGG